MAIHHFADDGSIPNNPTLPLLIYEDVLDLAGADVCETCDVAATCIERFAAHGWHGAWRNGIFPFPHYHSTAHEVLGICQGQAKVRLGGEHGLVMTVKAGDALVLPAEAPDIKIWAQTLIFSSLAPIRAVWIGISVVVNRVHERTNAATFEPYRFRVLTRYSGVAAR